MDKNTEMYMKLIVRYIISLLIPSQ